MLDRIEFALRKYEGIAPDLSDEMTTAQADQLKEWLNSDVKEITSSLLAHPGFRNRVLWPLDKLASRSVCDEREAVLAVDQSLVKFANCWLTLHENRPSGSSCTGWERTLRRFNPATRQILRKDCRL